MKNNNKKRMSIKNRYIFNQKAVVKGWLIKTFLLLLLLFVACGDGDEFMQFVHGGEDGEVVLTINTQLPSDGVSTRTAPTENITSITALAFNKNHELIKVQTEGVIKSTSSSTTGTFQIKVPKRTRRIHFIAKNNGVFDEITDIDYGKTDEELLVNRIGRINNSSHSEGILNALHYWQMLNFDRAEDLQDLSDELSELDKEPIKNDAGQDVYRLPLIRNMAKITLNLADGMTGHIAGVLNYNTTGTIVPYLKDEDGYKFGYQTDKNHELPESFVITSDVDECSELGLEHYLFEEYNDVGDLIYIMCFIDKVSTDEEPGRFYKVALVKPSFTDDTDKYFYVIRNQEYKINVQSSLNKSYGIENYADAVQNAKPINDTAEEQVHLDFEPDEVYMFLEETGTCNITIPQGIEGLMIGFSKDRFNSDGISIKTTAGDVIGATKQETPDNAGIYVNTYNVKDYSEIVLSMNLKESVTEAIKDMEIQFQGTGGGKVVNDKLVVHVLKRGDLPVTPISTELSVTSGSSFTATVGPIPSYEGINKYELNVSNADGVFTVTPPNGLSAQDNGCYLVNAGSSYTFTFTLNKEGKPGDVYKLDYNLNTEYHDLAGSTIVTLVEKAKTVQIEATTQTTSLYYTTYQNSVSDLMVDVTIPAGVTTLNFESEYFDVVSVNGRTKTENDVTTPYITVSNDGYSVNHQGESSLTLPFRLRLKNKTATTSAGFTFSGTGSAVIVTPATVNNITLQESDDEYVRWQGDVLLKWGNDGHVTQIPLPYSWFEGLSPGSTLRVDYEVTDADKSEDNRDAVIQFTEVKSDSWTEYPYNFTELKENNSEGAGVNLSKNTQSGSIYNRGGVIELNLTQTILEQMESNRTTFEGLSDIVMAIQGGNVRLKKISVIPKADIPENAPLSKIELDFYSAENRDNNVYEDLLLGTSHLYLTATISAEDAAKYAGQSVTVTLNGEFGVTQGQGKWSINWDGSRNAEDSSISSNSGATQLSFTIGYDNEGNPQTEYLIEWVFKTGQYYNAGEAIGFTYNISNYTISEVDGTFNNFTGDTSATIGFTNEPIGLEIYSEADTDTNDDIITIASGYELVMKATVPSDIPVGTEITFDLSNSIDVVADGLVWNEKNTSSVQMNWPNIRFTVEEGQRDYYLYWNPTVSDESRTATLSFTATIDGNSYNLNSVGNTSYSKTVTVTPNNNQTTGTVVWNEGKTYTGWSTDYIAVNTYIPTGSVITIYTSSSSTNGGAFEMHDIEERSLRFTNVNYPDNDDNYYSVASGETSHSFTVTNETTANGNTLANGVDGLKINGNNVTITRIVVQYPSMTSEVFNRDFEDESTINGWGENVERRNAQEGENHYLVLANKSGGFAQASLDRAYVPGNYTLTYKIKGNASDSISQVFQYFNDNQNIYESVVGSQSVVFGTDDWTIVTLDFEVTRGCNRLLFDYSDFTGEIYIDDLKLVKND